MFKSVPLHAATDEEAIEAANRVLSVQPEVTSAVLARREKHILLRKGCHGEFSPAPEKKLGNYTLYFECTNGKG